LFDIAMLTEHWIKTRGDIICDTFEFSEILFQDCESLNLSFLASQFWFNNWWEHRALDDTLMSVQLFIRK
jgi:DNA polymerase III epsilon subunit-like protein